MFLELSKNCVINTDEITHIQAEARAGVGGNYYFYRVYLTNGQFVSVSEPIYYAIRNFILHGEVNKNLTIWQKIKLFCSRWLESLRTKKLSTPDLKSNTSDEKGQI